MFGMFFRKMKINKISIKNIAISWKETSKKQDRDSFWPRYFVLAAILFLVVLSVAAWVFYYNQGLTLAYNDARSHLNVSRRVVDSLQPGLAQLGSVWLPLYHILELPFVWNDFLWHSGIAGSVVSVASFILAGITILAFAKHLRFDAKSAALALAVFALNPNLLFMQTTPMTESLLIFLSTIAVYFAIRWGRNMRLTDLMYAGVFTFLATLTRYDGWFLCAFMLLYVAYTAYKKKGWTFMEGNVIFYGFLAGFGILLWFLWNHLIFGDFLYFALGPFSAKAQQDVLATEGLLFTKGNLVYSTFLYLLAVFYNVGLWTGVLAVLAIVVLFIGNRGRLGHAKWGISLLLVPFVFNVFSLFIGHSVIHLPEIPPYTWFNDRYGLMLLPAIALAVGSLANRRKLIWLIAVGILATQTVSMYVHNDVISIEDGVRGASGEYLDNASDWVSDNLADGLILVAASSNDALLFRSGFPLKRFITEGARRYWDESLNDPTLHAKWIIMHKGDLVHENMIENDIFLNNYRLVYKDDFTYIYSLSPESGRISTADLPK